MRRNGRTIIRAEGLAGDYCLRPRPGQGGPGAGRAVSAEERGSPTPTRFRLYSAPPRRGPDREVPRPKLVFRVGGTGEATLSRWAVRDPTRRCHQRSPCGLSSYAMIASLTHLLDYVLPGHLRPASCPGGGDWLILSEVGMPKALMPSKAKPLRGHSWQQTQHPAHRT